MNSFKKLLVLIASMGLGGSAVAVEQTRGPDTSAAAVSGQADSIVASRVSISPASMNGYGSPVQEKYRMASVVAVKYTPADAGTRPTRATISGARPHSSANAGGMKLEVDRPADGTRIGLLAAAGVGGIAAPQTVRADAALRGFRFPLAAMPEPTEWMQLLCGLVVAGFIARRRTNVGAG
jgi:hypothetical protein